jgi:ribosomal protein RSM22 (predicted rRNA methylase)
MFMSVAFAVASMQAPAPPADPLRDLLREVRALRVAMERSLAVAPRVQLALARLTIEEQRTAQLGAQLDQVRRQLADATLESAKMSDALEDIEKMLQAPADEPQRRGLEFERTSLKRKLSAQAALEQQLRAREGEVAQSLAAEQVRWMELNARLDELERLLGPVGGAVIP